MGISLQVESENGKGIDFYFIIKQQVINCEPIGNFADFYKKYQGNTLMKKMMHFLPHQMQTFWLLMILSLECDLEFLLLMMIA